MQFCCLNDISKNGKHSCKLVLVHIFGHHSDEKFVLTIALRSQVSELHLSRSRRLPTIKLIYFSNHTLYDNSRFL